MKHISTETTVAMARGVIMHHLDAEYHQLYTEPATWMGDNRLKIELMPTEIVFSYTNDVGRRRRWKHLKTFQTIVYYNRLMNNAPDPTTPPKIVLLPVQRDILLQHCIDTLHNVYLSTRAKEIQDVIDVIHVVLDADIVETEK